MKGFKFMIAATLLAVATSASAQFENTLDSVNVDTKASPSSLMAKRPIHEISLYLQDGCGLGYQLRKDLNQYIAWNIVGVSYMTHEYNTKIAPGTYLESTYHVSAWPLFKADYLINCRFFGVRLNSPTDKKKVRLYTDLNMGYTYGYTRSRKINGTKCEGGSSDAFGLDFGVGVQIGKHFTIGYNLNFLKGSENKTTEKGSEKKNTEKNHWGKIGFLF